MRFAMLVLIFALALGLVAGCGGGGGILPITSGQTSSDTTPDYTVTGILGGYGTGDGQFDQPYGLDISGDRLLVTDRRNNRVVIFGLSGNHLGQFGTRGSALGQLESPVGVTTNISGTIYVTESGNHRVQVFDTVGNPLSSFGSLGTGNGQLNYPTDISVGSDGTIVVADHGNRRVQKFKSNGDFVAWPNGADSLPGITQPMCVEHDNLDRIWVTDSGDNTIKQYAASGDLVQTIPNGNYGGASNYAYGIVFGTDNTAFTTHADTLLVQKMDTAGNLITRWGSPGTSPGQFNYPWGIDLDADGNVYVSDVNNHRVQRFSPTQ